MHGQQFAAHHGGYTCDICHKGQPKGAVLWGCRACDYDACDVCYGRLKWAVPGEKPRVPASLKPAPPPGRIIDGEFVPARSKPNNAVHPGQRQLGLRKAPEVPDPGFNPGVGDVLEAQWKGRPAWYRGAVRNVCEDGAYDVAYEDGDYEEGVSRHFIRRPRVLLGNVAADPFANDLAVPKFGDGSDGESDEAEAPQFYRPDQGFNPAVGDKVEAKWHGGFNWYRGFIERVNDDGSFAIQYDDGDFDGSVGRRNIRRSRWGEEGGGL